MFIYIFIVHYIVRFGVFFFSQSDFYYTPYVDDLRIVVDELQDESWHFAVAYGNQTSGLVWESCVFDCRSCGMYLATILEKMKRIAKNKKNQLRIAPS